MSGVVIRDANEVDLLAGLALNSTGTKTGTAHEVAWPGPHLVIVEALAITGTSPTCDITIQGCETADFSTADVVEIGTINLVGTDDNGEFAIVANGDYQYIRAVAVVGGTSPVFTGTTAKLVPLRYHQLRGKFPTAAALV